LWRTLCYSGEPLDLLISRAINGAAQGILHVAAQKPLHQSVTALRDDQVDNSHQQ
jgi:hypothetical protein